MEDLGKFGSEFSNELDRCSHEELSRELFSSMLESKMDMRSIGSHYKVAIEPIEYIEENGLSFSEGNVVKYITRHKRKGGVEDVLKAIDYCVYVLRYEYGVLEGDALERIEKMLKCLKW